MGRRYWRNRTTINSPQGIRSYGNWRIRGQTWPLIAWSIAQSSTTPLVMKAILQTCKTEHNNMQVLQWHLVQKMFTLHFATFKRLYTALTPVSDYWTSDDVIRKITLLQAGLSVGSKFQNEPRKGNKRHHCVALWGLYNKLFLHFDPH